MKIKSRIPTLHKTVEEVNKEVYTAPGDVAEKNSSNVAPNSRAAKPQTFPNESAISTNRLK
jgi:hypothetical protein